MSHENRLRPLTLLSVVVYPDMRRTLHRRQACSILHTSRSKLTHRALWSLFRLDRLHGPSGLNIALSHNSPLNDAGNLRQLEIAPTQKMYDKVPVELHALDAFGLAFISFIFFTILHQSRKA